MFNLQINSIPFNSSSPFYQRYEGEQECEGEDECGGQWFTSDWATCSASCGGGTQTRKVFCLKDRETVEPGLCGEDLTPFTDQDCNKESCDAPEDDGEGSGEGSGSGSGSGDEADAEDAEEEEKEEEEPIDTAGED